MLNINRILKSNRQTRALIGLNKSEFLLLAETFNNILYIERSKKQRVRKIGGGRKSILRSSAIKLFFILFYLKVYPTYDLASAIFGLDRSRICRWVKFLLPLVEKALNINCTLPKRRINSFEELFNEFPVTKDIFIDATERLINRPSKHKVQSKSYSGKRKCHTRKNTIICNDSREILYVSKSKAGKLHDFKQLQKENILHKIPDKICLWVDKGYQGINNLVPDDQIVIPHKKPKGKSLTSTEKEENKTISSIRITVEHAIAGVKRFGCLSHKYRNRKGQDDSMFTICAGLWNFHLQNS